MVLGDIINIIEKKHPVADTEAAPTRPIRKKAALTSYIVYFSQLSTCYSNSVSEFTCVTFDLQNGTKGSAFESSYLPAQLRHNHDNQSGTRNHQH